MSHCVMAYSFIRLEKLQASFQTNSSSWSGICKREDARRCRIQELWDPTSGCTCLVTKMLGAFNLLCVCIYGTLLVDITPSRRNWSDLTWRRNYQFHSILLEFLERRRLFASKRVWIAEVWLNHAIGMKRAIQFFAAKETNKSCFIFSLTKILFLSDFSFERKWKNLVIFC